MPFENILVIKMNKKLYESGAHTLNLKVDKDESLSLSFKEGSEGSLFIELDGNGDLNINYDFLKNSQWNVLTLNKSSQELKIKEAINLYEDSNLSMNYGELSYGAHKRDTVASFLEEGSELELNAAILCFDSFKWNLLAHHLAKRTIANVNNQAIVLKNAVMNLDIIGKIDNGYSGSETHQMSRIMNMGDGLNTTVHPQLLIEENDVAASHAASVGQANEEHIYYLQSRGLSREQALKLIVLGYLMPIVELIPEDETKELLEEEIQRKVMEAWTL